MKTLKTPPSKFSCDVCPKQFNKQKLLNIHRENHTFNHRCEECNVNMANMVEVGKHRSALHKGVTFTRCTECKTGWMKESSLSHHKQQFHKNKEAAPSTKSNLLNVSDIKQILAEAPVDDKQPSADIEEVNLEGDDIEGYTLISEDSFEDDLVNKRGAIQANSTLNKGYIQANSTLNNSQDSSSNDSGIGLDSSISYEEKDFSKDRAILKTNIFKNLKKAISGKSKNNVSINAELKRLREEVETSKTNAREVQEKQNSLNIEIRRLKHQIQSTTQLNGEEQTKMKKDLEQKQSEFEVLQKSKDEEILNLKVKMEKSQSRINKAKDLVTECLEYKKKCAELSKKFKETETDFLVNKKQLEEKTESLDNANQTVNELRNTLNQLRNAMEKSNKEKIEVEQNLEVCKSLNAEKTEKLNSLTERVKKAEAGSDKRVGNVLQSLRAELDKLGSQNAKLRQILKAKDDELGRFRSQQQQAPGQGVIRKIDQQNILPPSSKRTRR